MEGGPRQLLDTHAMASRLGAPAVLARAPTVRQLMLLSRALSRRSGGRIAPHRPIPEFGDHVPVTVRVSNTQLTVGSGPRPALDLARIEATAKQTLAEGVEVRRVEVEEPRAWLVRVAGRYDVDPGEHDLGRGGGFEPRKL